MASDVVQCATSDVSPTNLTTAELAELLRVNTSTVRRWVMKGIITPTITTPGGHHRFDREGVIAQLNRRAS